MQSGQFKYPFFPDTMTPRSPSAEVAKRRIMALAELVGARYILALSVSNTNDTSLPSPGIPAYGHEPVVHLSTYRANFLFVASGRGG